MHLLLALALLQTPAPPPPSAPTPATAAPVENPAVTALARKIYGQMQAGKVDPALLTPEMQAAATPELLTQSKPMIDQLGNLKDLKLESVSKLPTGTAYLYQATFPQAQFHVSILIDAAGKVAGYFLKP